MQLLELFVRILSAFGNLPPTGGQERGYANADIPIVPIEAVDSMSSSTAGVVAGRRVRNASEVASAYAHPIGSGSDKRYEYRVRECEPIILPIGFNKIKLSPRPIGNCPSCCPIRMQQDLRLLLFTKANPTNGIQLKLRPGTLRQSGFKSTNPTVIFIHGFIEVCSTKSSSYAIRDAYLSRPESYNVILVDWSNLSAGPWYGQAAENTILVSDTLGHFLQMFHKSGEISMDRVHLIGFSLGAQIAGMTGKHLKDSHIIDRITGLDPALPLYPIKDVAHRITKEDAKFVDVIHTAPILFGYPVSIGHVDFYVNPDKDIQPGCSFEELVLSNKLDDYFSCSHQLAWNIYVETVRNPGAYPAYNCDKKGDLCRDRVFMGFNVSRSSQGDYFVTTT